MVHPEWLHTSRLDILTEIPLPLNENITGF